MDARRGYATVGAARLENGHGFDRPEIKADRASHTQAKGHLEQTPGRGAEGEGEMTQGRGRVILSRAWTPEEDVRLRRLAEDGRSAAVIAERLKGSRGSVYMRMRKLGIRLRRTGRKAKGK
jgi:DNA-binding CsgD family transcriptional regulator